MTSIFTPDAETVAALADAADVLDPVATALLGLDQSWQRTTLAVFTATDADECYAAALDVLAEMARKVGTLARLIESGRTDLDVIAGGGVR